MLRTYAVNIITHPVCNENQAKLPSKPTFPKGKIGLPTMGSNFTLSKLTNPFVVRLQYIFRLYLHTWLLKSLFKICTKVKLPNYH